MATSMLLAHQGGWDEALFVAVPMLVVAILLALAKRRVATAQARATGATTDDGHETDNAGASEPTEP